MEQIVKRYLFDIGISTNLTGFKLLQEVILQCLDMNRVNLTLVYCRVSNNEITIKQIERNIRTAIASSFARGKIQRLNEIFKAELCDEGYCPTNKEIITLGVEYVRQRMHECENAL